MKNIKTYEGFIGNALFKIFSNKYVKKIVLNFNKILSDKISYDFSWSTAVSINFKDQPYFLKDNKSEKIYIEIKAEHQWLEIEMRDTNFAAQFPKEKEIPEIDYFKSLIIKYGDPWNNPSYNNNNNCYYLTLSNVEKLISKLNMEDFMLYKNMKKFNI